MMKKMRVFKLLFHATHVGHGQMGAGVHLVTTENVLTENVL